MATIREVILPNQKREDGTWNVKIRVTHQRKVNYISTQHYVGAKQIRPDHSIKDPIILNAIYPTLKDYREKISDLGPKLEVFDLPRLIDYLTNKTAITADEINVIAFGRKMIADMKEAGREGSAHTINTVVNGLVDFFGSEKVPITEIRAAMLVKYEKYLRSEREITRINQLGKEVTRTMPGLSDNGLHNHMRDLRTLFNAARDHYNNDDLGLYKIKHYPFKKYKVGSATLTKKRNITIEQVKLIRSCKPVPDSRAELAKDLFMLSFYLCGTNAVDFYHLQKKDIKHGRIEYNRAKTKGRRRDNAFISIKLINEAKPLLEKYIEVLPQRYKKYDGLDTALSAGMKDLRKITGIDGITFYWARHTLRILPVMLAELAKMMLRWH